MSEWPDGEIEELVKGERPTLIEAEKGNELIDALNVLGKITIEKGTDDEVQYSADGVRIIYKYPPDGWEEKVIEICEDGSAIEYTFLVKT
tara:strand:+ start:39 stop:308 length:270 start_codon:yes stop_codon:yes gene_type:complete